MNPIHIVTEKKNIAKNVLTPGDPLRAKYIAENFLDNYKLVNTIRNMYIYTGEYKGKKVTIASSGMGIPSMGIYAYELYKFYNVENIIRIGTSGTVSKDVKVGDIVISDEAYSISNFNEIVNNDLSNHLKADRRINDIIESVAKENNLSYMRGNTYTSDVFDVYCNIDKYLEQFKENNLLIVEMEAFSLYTVSKYFNKKSTTIVTVVDSKFEKVEISPKERETSLNNMIKLALESIIKLGE